jgi:hypothetical protein
MAGLSRHQADVRVRSCSECCFAAVADKGAITRAAQIKLNAQSVDREPFP